MDQLKKQQELEKYAIDLLNKSLDELKKLEQEVVKEAEKADKDVTTKTFDLPSKNYEETAKAIRMLLNKQSVQWQYTVGLITMYDFWADKNPKKVNYPMLDGTLRTLGQMSFTGYDEWKAVVTINTYFDGLREEYVKVTDKVWTIAAKHDAILKRLEMFETDIPKVDAPGEDVEGPATEE